MRRVFRKGMAVALAAALHADACEIYTDVDGVFTADPRIVKKPKKIDNISSQRKVFLFNKYKIKNFS